MDFTVIEDIEKGDCVGDPGGIVPCGDHGKKLITEALLVGNCVALLGNRNEQSLHESWKGRGLARCGLGHILIDATSGELDRMSQYMLLRWANI